MFSYGVCCLFACCLPPTAELQQQAIRRFNVDDRRKLSAWSREEAKKADAHLPNLLESLLADAATNEEALARRLSASQTLRHAFLDTAAALEVSTKAQQAAAKASQEAEQQMAAVEQEAARRDREAAWREAEQRRRQAEQEEAHEAAIKQSELEAAAKRNEIQREERCLEQERQKVRKQEAEAEARVRAAARARSAEIGRVPSPNGISTGSAYRVSTLRKKDESASSNTPAGLCAACSRNAKSQKRQPIWLPHWPTCTVMISRGMSRASPARTGVGGRLRSLARRSHLWCRS